MGRDFGKYFFLRYWKFVWPEPVLGGFTRGRRHSSHGSLLAPAPHRKHIAEEVTAGLVAVDYKRISRMASRGGAPNVASSVAAVPPVTRVRTTGGGIKLPSIDLPA